MTTLLLIRIKMGLTSKFIQKLLKLDFTIDQYIDLDGWIIEKDNLALLSAIISLMSTMSLLKYLSKLSKSLSLYIAMLTYFIKNAFSTGFMLYMLILSLTILWLFAALGNFNEQWQYFFMIFRFFQLTLGNIHIYLYNNAYYYIYRTRLLFFTEISRKSTR